VLFRDPVAVAHGEAYFGLVSNLGILAWTAAAAICLFAGLQLRLGGTAPLHASFFLWSSAITTVLLLDDLFLLHEIRQLRVLGLTETVLFGGYGAVICLCLFLHRRATADFDLRLLATALAMFAASLFFARLTGHRFAGLVDTSAALHFLKPLLARIDPVATLLEDGPKLIGIFAWAAFLTTSAWKALRQYPTACSPR